LEVQEDKPEKPYPSLVQAALLYATQGIVSLAQVMALSVD
jgi:hypothetical protein